MKFVKKERAEAHDHFFSVRILNGEGKALFDGPLNGLRFPDGVIVNRSILFFNDPEPCFIHRGAVAARLFGELNFLLEKKDQYSVEELNEVCPGCLDEYGGAVSLQRQKEKK